MGASGGGGSASSVCGRRLPKTPSQPPGTIIVIENILPQTSAANGTAGQQAVAAAAAVASISALKPLKKHLPATPKPQPASSSSKNATGLGRLGRVFGGAGNVNAVIPGFAGSKGSSAVDGTRRSYSLPRKGDLTANTTPTTTFMDKVHGSGRRLPPTPNGTTAQQGPLPLHKAAAKPRKRELPKPQSLELRHSNREFMNSSNLILGLVKPQAEAVSGGGVGAKNLLVNGATVNGSSGVSLLAGLNSSSNRSMNFPRVDGSPTHSECSSTAGSILNLSGSRRALFHQRHRRRLPY